MTTTKKRPLPKRLGRYDVGAKLAGGGMATVHVGRSVEPDGEERFVALKVIREELARDDKFVQMFLDEAKILSRLSHPNVIHTLEFGVTEQHPFIAMELLMGRTLVDAWDLSALANARLPIVIGAWICARVAAGLHSAHELVGDDGAPLHVIHRDVNPSNIFLTYGGDVRLIDFGLAKANGRRTQSDADIIKGKIPYLAPEQTTGQQMDRRIDLFALGTTLWELGTGKRLFKRNRDVDTINAIREAKVPDPRTIVDGYPESLWAIVDRALKPNPEERYSTAAELEKDLDAFVIAEGAKDLAGELSRCLEGLFPGEGLRQSEWLRAAARPDRPVGEPTMPPPAPVPMARSKDLGAATGSTPDSQAELPLPARKAAEKQASRTAGAESDRRMWARVAAAFIIVLVLAAFLFFR